MKMNKLAAAVALSLAAASALATVTLNFTDGAFNGTGWVGKGDVQLVYGWNNKQIQERVVPTNYISFTFDTIDSYEGVCTWTTGVGTPGEKIHNVTHKKSTGITSVVVNSDPRNISSGKLGPNTGFKLTSFGATLDGGDIDGDSGLFKKYPLVLGGPCPGNPGTAGVWTSITAVTSSGGLYVWNAGADPKLLWDASTPPPL